MNAPLLKAGQMSPYRHTAVICAACTLLCAQPSPALTCNGLGAFNQEIGTRVGKGMTMSTSRNCSVRTECDETQKVG